jgi:hypothetical protein
MDIEVENGSKVKLNARSMDKEHESKFSYKILLTLFLPCFGVNSAWTLVPYP